MAFPEDYHRRQKSLAPLLQTSTAMRHLLLAVALLTLPISLAHAGEPTDQLKQRVDEMLPHGRSRGQESARTASQRGPPHRRDHFRLSGNGAARPRPPLGPAHARGAEGVRGPVRRPARPLVPVQAQSVSGGEGPLYRRDGGWRPGDGEDDDRHAAPVGEIYQSVPACTRSTTAGWSTT